MDRSWTFMRVEIVRLDDLGRGVAYVDGKITFVPKTIPGDIVRINITKEKKKFNEAECLELIASSPSRIAAPCPYFAKCGGCQLQSLEYDKTIQYKKEKIDNILRKNKIVHEVEMIDNPKPYNYRNKISLKVIDGKIGYYLSGSHELIEVLACRIANLAINTCLSFVKTFNIINGEVVIRCNQNEEILLVINSNDKLDIDVDKLKKHIKLVGIIINNKVYYGESYLFERINNCLFKISYDSFFQVNPYVASKLFQIVKDNIRANDKVLDLYCGVGTLSLMAGEKAKSVVGIEIVPNAILNAIFNAQINGLNNVKFLLNDVKDAINKITLDFTKVIVDPPRSGLTKDIIEVLLKIKPESIIYVSCDPQTLVRDYKLLMGDYVLEKAYALDMFSYTYHVESLWLLKRR